MEQNGQREKLGIFSDKRVLPIPHPCCRDNSVDGEGHLACLSMFCFKNNTEETTHLSYLSLLKMENVGRRGRPGVLVLGNDQGLELRFPELSSELQKDWGSPQALSECLYIASGSERTELCVQGRDAESYYFCFINHPARELATFKPLAARSYKFWVCKLSATQSCLCLGGNALVGEELFRGNPEHLGKKGTNSLLI